jgi:threonyl-tRNA synthetase
MADNQSEDALQIMRHSTAHVMATAVQRLWPEAKFGVGPAVEHGFYYDIDLGEDKISEDDFAKIEAEMQKIKQESQPINRREVGIDEAINWAKEHNQPYKEELLNDLKRSGTTVANDLNKDEMGTIATGDSQVDSVSFYDNGDFTDLCRGPHVENTSQIGVLN